MDRVNLSSNSGGENEGGAESDALEAEEADQEVRRQPPVQDQPGQALVHQVFRLRRSHPLPP